MLPVDQYRGRPKYRNEVTHAIIYWAGFWKMNYFDDAAGWYYYCAVN